MGGKLVAYFSEHLSEADFNLFGSTRGDPAFQSEYELLAVLVALRVFKDLIASHGANMVVIRGDNTAVLQAVFTYKTHSPLMTQLTAEVALELEAQGLQHRQAC